MLTIINWNKKCLWTSCYKIRLKSSFTSVRPNFRLKIGSGVDWVTADECRPWGAINQEQNATNKRTNEQMNETQQTNEQMNEWTKRKTNEQSFDQTEGKWHGQCPN